MRQNVLVTLRHSTSCGNLTYAENVQGRDFHRCFALRSFIPSPPALPVQAILYLSSHHLLD